MTTTYQPPTYVDADGTPVEAVLIATPDDVLALRESDWADGQVRVLTYPTHPPVAFVAVEPPFEFGQEISLGDFVVKLPAGNLAVISPLMFTHKFSRVDA